MTGSKGSKRERQEKILVAMHDVAGGTTRLCNYEDIVVRAWEMHPGEFGLRGYTDRHPDSSDLHKPLYGPMKREGWVRAQNKRFGLTERGLALAQQVQTGSTEPTGEGRVGRHERDELTRLGMSSAVRLVSAGQGAKLLDTDLYEFYGATVRTKPHDFAGRKAAVDAAIEAGIRTADPSLHGLPVAEIVEARNQLTTRFADLMVALATAKSRSRS